MKSCSKGVFSVPTRTRDMLQVLLGYTDN